LLIIFSGRIWPWLGRNRRSHAWMAHVEAILDEIGFWGTTRQYPKLKKPIPLECSLFVLTESLFLWLVVALVRNGHRLWKWSQEVTTSKAVSVGVGPATCLFCRLEPTHFPLYGTKKLSFGLKSTKSTKSTILFLIYIGLPNLPRRGRFGRPKIKW
jgi:hypothetical protein